jgi:hypothetical protein
VDFVSNRVKKSRSLESNFHAEAEERGSEVFKRPFRTSQETHNFSATETSRLMLFKETVTVYCENHTEHTNTVRTSQETHYGSATETSRLMLFRETVTVYCENHAEHTASWAEYGVSIC